MSDRFDTLYPSVCLYLRVFVNLIKVQFVFTTFLPAQSVVCGFVMLRFHDNQEAVTRANLGCFFCSFESLSVAQRSQHDRPVRIDGQEHNEL